MTDMLWWTVQNTIMAAILAAFVALICGLARPRPAVRHALWLVVLVKLLTPPLVAWPWPAAAAPRVEALAADLPRPPPVRPPDDPAPEALVAVPADPGAGDVELVPSSEAEPA